MVEVVGKSCGDWKNGMSDWTCLVAGERGAVGSGGAELSVHRVDHGLELLGRKRPVVVLGLGPVAALVHGRRLRGGRGGRGGA